MKKKYCILVVLMTLMGVSFAQSSDYDFRLQSSTDPSLGYFNIGGFCANLDFKINPDSTTVTLVKVSPLSGEGYGSIGTRLVLPSTVTLGFGEEASVFPITAIGERAFAGTSPSPSNAIRFSSLTLPPTILEIHPYALSWLVADSLTICGSVQHMHDSVFVKPIYPGTEEPFWPYFNFLGSMREWLDMDIDGKLSNPIANSLALLMDGVPVDTVVIPEGDRIVKPNHFAYNTPMRSLTLPSTLDSLGDGCFSFCTQLDHIAIPYNVRYIGNECFRGCSAMQRVEFNALNCQYAGTFYHGVFADCNEISEIVIGEHVQVIPDVLFMYCSGVSHIDLPQGLQRIGTASFAQCTGLQGMEIPESVTSIGGNAFDRCTGLDTLVFNPAVCTLEGGSTMPAFTHDTNISTLIIGSNVSVLGESCFKGLKGVRKVESLAWEPPFVPNISALEDIDQSALLMVPCGAEWDYREAFGWENFGTVRSVWSYEFNIDSEDESKGTVQIRTQPRCDYLYGEILAHPNSGYAFSHWSDGSTADHRWVAVTGDIHLTAYFEESLECIDGVVGDEVRAFARQHEIVVQCDSEQQVLVCDMLGRVVANERMVGQRQFGVPATGVYVVKAGPTAVKVVVGR